MKGSRGTLGTSLSQGVLTGRSAVGNPQAPYAGLPAVDNAVSKKIMKLRMQDDLVEQVQ